VRVSFAMMGACVQQNAAQYFSHRRAPAVHLSPIFVWGQRGRAIHGAKMRVLPWDFPPGGVLVAGAGGGFDFLCGLPIVLELERRGHKVHIANYSFTRLSDVCGGTWHGETLLQITADARLARGDYFPEQLLARWYRQRKGIEKSIWCLAQGGVAPTTHSYDFLIDRLGIETVICIDGGVDGIFRGDEWDLATPSMDSISVIATSLCRARQRIYACTAFGTEGAEGKVSHAQALARMADLVRADALLGVGTTIRKSEVGRDFLDAVETIFNWSAPLKRSIVVGTLQAAIQGAFGPTVVGEKTRERPPWVSPLTSLIWYFEADSVARLKLFYKSSLGSTTVEDVAQAIDQARQRAGVQPYESIPI
jgi:hypothetical protein